MTELITRGKMRRYRRGRMVAAVAGLLMAATVVAAFPTAANADAKSQRGVASWYGPRFHGKKTASGERFDQSAMTAAHRSLPLGTQVLVTNLDNGRTVKVRINDRGPRARGRVIDLSKASARILKFIKSGSARVRIDVIGEKIKSK